MNPSVRGNVGKLFPKVLRGMLGCEILERYIQIVHIHLLMVIPPPKYVVSDVIGKMKQYTASRMREKFAWLENVYWKERVVWSPGYFVSTVGLDEKQITEYVKWQSHQDSGQAKLEVGIYSLFT
ncbi:MAG: IS200/IS605 family transposase [Dehalococcoidia bacterium]|nr:IS200/IS605 family transposase [Dehalococcoidia bacterium]